MHLASTLDLSSMRKDLWFTRGWTLQELLAPKRLRFFGKSWKRITPNSVDNDKTVDNFLVPLWHHISDITSISIDRLLHFNPGIDNAREALVWASKRQTTRVEDIAYCLIGMLDVPLSIAYGEGNMAFRRLQVEILQHSHDMGLFAWTGQSSSYNSMLAAGPNCFSSLTLQPLFAQAQMDSNSTSVDPAYALTKYGLRIPLPVYSAKILRKQDSQTVLGNTSTSMVEISLQAEELGEITVKSPDLTKYEAIEVAILVDLAGKPSTIAILLGCEDRRWKRIPTEHHITLRRRKAWRTPKIRFLD